MGLGMNWIWEHADKLGGLGEAVTAIVAIVAAIIAFTQIGSAWRSQRDATNAATAAQREATAKDIYRDFLRQAIQYPSYADGEQTDDAAYKWFVAFLLAACDELLLANPNDEGWQQVIEEELYPHCSYLGSKEFNNFGGWGMYSQELADIGATVIANCD
jgi:hypothetical protein